MAVAVAVVVVVLFLFDSSIINIIVIINTRLRQDSLTLTLTSLTDWLAFYFSFGLSASASFQFQLEAVGKGMCFFLPRFSTQDHLGQQLMDSGAALDKLRSDALKAVRSQPEADKSLLFSHLKHVWPLALSSPVNVETLKRNGPKVLHSHSRSINEAWHHGINVE